MSIKELEITGYRSFREAVWKPGALNLVVGPNGSGKSNLLQLLELIANAANGKLAKSIADAGGMVPLLWDHQPGAIGWKLSLGSAECQDREATFDLLIRQLGGGSAYQIENDSFVVWRESDKDFAASQNVGYSQLVQYMLLPPLISSL